MEKFLERYKLPTVIQKEIENLPSPILVKDIEFVIFMLMYGKNHHNIVK